MTADTARRHALYEHAKASWDAETAETLMDLLPPDREHLATTSDLRGVQTDIVVLGAELRTEMGELRTELRTEMGELRTELRTEMGELRTDMANLSAELRTEMGELRTELRTEVAGIRVEMADLRADMAEKFSEQTRTLMVASVTTMLSGVGLAFAAAHFA